MIELICGQWYLVRTIRHFYEDWTDQWKLICNLYNQTLKENQA